MAWEKGVLRRQLLLWALVMMMMRNAIGSIPSRTWRRIPLRVRPAPASVDEGLEDKEMQEDTQFLESPVALHKAYVLALVTSTVLTFLMFFLIPMPMFFSRYIYSAQFFTGWVAISFIWVFASLLICGILPVGDADVLDKPASRDIQV